VSLSVSDFAQPVNNWEIGLGCYLYVRRVVSNAMHYQQIATNNTHIDFNVAVSGASDNGITMSAGFGHDAGRQVDTVDYELDGEEAAASDISAHSADQDADDAVSGNNNPVWATAAPSLTIGYNGFTVTADGSGVSDLYNGDVNSGDLGISG